MKIHGYDRWSIRFDHCEGCGTQSRPHKARGYCSTCYSKLYEAGQLRGTVRAEAGRDIWIEDFLEAVADYLWYLKRNFGIDTGLVRTRTPIPRVPTAKCEFCHRRFLNTPQYFDDESEMCLRCLDFVTRPVDRAA